ncbi:MAG: M14 family zinc carboxypeptidase, partial [Gemmatimonadota bacterium]
MRRCFLLCLVLATTFPAALGSQQIDSAYTRLIREHTSDPKFLPRSWASIEAHASVPSPLEHFGTIIGAPGVMHRVPEILGYYRALDAASPRVEVRTIGKTEEGRDLVIVIISAGENIGQLEIQRANAARLADPRTISRGDAETLSRTTKPVYYISGGLHSPEMGSPEMLMELAYRLAVSDDARIRDIRDKLIVIINPVAEPDGRDRQVDWYYRYTKKSTDWDDGMPRSAPYWGKYIYHDNNRDGIQLSAALTRAFARAYYEWHPIVMHDLHESVPLLYISTGTGPYNETIDPITIGEWQVLANHDLTSVTAEGLPGVFTWAFYDGWWPGYAIWIANNHNSIGRFYETFGNAGANTFVRDLSTQRYAGDPVTSAQWYRPAPATRKVRWSARDNVNYMQAGVLASLEYAANNTQSLLRNFYQKGVNNLERGRREKPHAFVIPRFAQQRDPRRAAYLVNQLQRQGIEVHARMDGDSAGDFVVLLNQPYRNHAVSLLTKQNFPSGAPNPPYDDIAWTLGYMYGVDVSAVNDSAVFEWNGLQLLTDTTAYSGRAAGAGSTYVVKYKGQSEVLPMLYSLKTTACAVEQQIIEGNDTIPRGSIILNGITRERANEVARKYGLDLQSHAPMLPCSHARNMHPLDLPKVALYHTWHSTQDEGWARYTFDQMGIPYTSIHKDDARRGNLRARFDVILFPSAGGGVESLIHEVDPKHGPMPYTRTADFPSHGTPSATSDMTGGMGYEGLAELQKFVREGGVLITMKESTRLLESGFVRELDVLSPGQLFHPGSVVRAKIRRPDHPLMYGYPEVTHIFRGNGPLYSVAKRDRDLMLMQYGTKPLQDEEKEKDEGKMLGIPRDPPAPAAAPRDTAPAEKPAPVTAPAPATDYVLSGMVRNADVIQGQGAIFDIPLG